MKKIMATALLAGSLAVCSNASASVIFEGADFGETLGTAFTLDAGTTTVIGEAASGDNDLLRFGWGGGQFEASLQGDNDPYLYLFDLDGQLVTSDDDSLNGGFPDLDSLIDINLSAGTYFIAASSWQDSPIYDLSGILSGWSGSGVGADNYLLSFNNPTVTAVPIPAAAWMFGTALMGLVGFRKAKKAKA